MKQMNSIELHRWARVERARMMAALARAAWRWLTRGWPVAGSKLVRGL